MPKFLTKEEYIEKIQLNARKYYPLMKKISENIVSTAEEQVTSKLEEFKYSQKISLHSEVNKTDLDSMEKGHMGYRLCSQLRNNVKNLLEGEHIEVISKYSYSYSECEITISGRKFTYGDFETDLLFEKEELKRNKEKNKLNENELNENEPKQNSFLTQFWMYTKF